MQSTSWETLDWEKQAGIKISRRNINNLRYADDTTLMAESEEELKSFLMKVKEESGKVGLKLNIQKMKIMASGTITSWEIDGETVEIVYFGGLQNHCRWWLQPWNYKTLTPWKESYDQPRQHILKQRHCFANKVPSSQSYGFSCSHGWTIKLDHKESWASKNWCFCTVMLKTLESLGLQGDQTSQSQIFIGKTDGETEAPIVWPPDAKNWLIGKDPNAGKYWRQEEKGMTEDEMVG